MLESYSFGNIESDFLLVDNVTDKICNSCSHALISTPAIIQASKSGFSFLHLQCYNPINSTYIFDYNYLSTLSNDSDISTFNQWLNNINRQHPILNKPQKLDIRVETKLSRTLKEIYKYFTIEELMILRRVSKEWYTIFLSKEIWLYLLRRDYFMDTGQIIDPFEVYFGNLLNHCYFCHKSSYSSALCPLLLRKICKKCQCHADDPYHKCGLINKNNAKFWYKINDKWLQDNKIRFWKIASGEEITYNWLIQRKINVGKKE
ncbi:unnamed protein product [Blepharisma stoltei]|uniref:F-box domain-containing protein n=1 Tax=Blepharisma stoltei TaxID=1481888 RepID=A0AAU9K5M3_9CILI|nr:unnamed protein product [Blepharisma stoltei]